MPFKPVFWRRRDDSSGPRATRESLSQNTWQLHGDPGDRAWCDVFVGAEDLEARRNRLQSLRSALQPHAVFLSQMLTYPHAVCLLDAEGVLLDVVSNDSSFAHRCGLLPGAQRGESFVGTTAAGLALQSGSPRVVVGRQHSHRGGRHCTTVAVPVLDSQQRRLAVLELCAPQKHAPQSAMPLLEYVVFSLNTQSDGQLPHSAALPRLEDVLTDSGLSVASVLENISDSIAILDAQWRFVYLNRRAEAMLGVQPGELLGQNIWQRYPQALDSLVYEKYHEARRTRETVQFELYCTNFKMCMAVTVYPTSKDCVVVFSRDVTAQKQQERYQQVEHATARVLAEAETMASGIHRLLREVGQPLEMAWGALWRCDAEGQRIGCCESWSADPDHSREFDAASRVRTLSIGEGLPGRAGQLLGAIRTTDFPQSLVPERARLAAACGWNSALAFPIRWHDRLLGVLEFLGTDVPELTDELRSMFEVVGRQLGQFLARREAEEALQRRSDELQRLNERANETLTLLATLLDNLPMGFAYLNRDLRVVRANRALSEIDCIPISAYVGQTASEMVPDIAATVEPILRRVLQTGQAVEGFEMSRTIPGTSEQREWMVSFYPITYPGSGTLGVGVIVADITERKRLEEALRQRAEELASMARRKDEFLAMLSHELRNPLAPIGNALALLESKDLDEDTAAEARQIMKRQFEHLVRVVDDLLDVSRVIRGRIQLHRRLIPVDTIVRRALETVRPTLQEHQHQLQVTLPEEPLWVEADEIRMAQVIANLLHNAIKYTDEGGRIAVGAAAEGGEVVVRVRDNGVGIDPLLLPHVFDLFSQGDRSLDRSQGGLGIGLALVRSLVEMHGGVVQALSEGPGQGSEFVIRLPAKTGATDTRPAVDGAAAQQHLRILIVEDNRGAGIVLAKLLSKQYGHDVTVAYDGLDAIHRAEAFRPHLVLCDIGLPVFDGYEVARRLRSQRAFDRTLLVALTGYGQQSDRRECLAAGFDEHLIKPPSTEMLEALFAHPKLARATEEP